MRNGDNRDTRGPTPEIGMYSSAVTRISRRRKQAMIGAGLVVILGVGGVVVGQALDDDDTAPASRTGALDDDDTAPASRTGALEPVVPLPPASVGTSTGASPGAAAAGTKPSRLPSTTAPRRKTDAERIAAARSAAPKSSSQVRRPPSNVGVSTVGQTDVTTSTVKQDGERLKIMSARKDLTDYRELAWIADGGTKVGEALCTQKIRVGAGAEARVRPTLLLCWRTSATKSVYTVAVKFDGMPSKELSVAALDKEWAKLG